MICAFTIKANKVTNHPKLLVHRSVCVVSSDRFMILKGEVDMEALEKDYRINEQGMVLECRERPDSSIKVVRTFSLRNLTLSKLLRSIQDLVAGEQKPV
jgi:hypothetical protein